MSLIPFTVTPRLLFDSQSLSDVGRLLWLNILTTVEVGPPTYGAIKPILVMAVFKIHPHESINHAYDYG